MKVRRVCNVHDGGNNNICCQVGLISSMDRALHPGITKFRTRFQVKPEFFQVLFQQLSLFILLLRSCSLSY